MKELDVINEILNTNVTEENLGEALEDALEWDSYKGMNFLAEMEDRYQTEVDMEDIMMAENVDGLARIVKKYER